MNELQALYYSVIAETATAEQHARFLELLALAENEEPARQMISDWIAQNQSEQPAVAISEQRLTMMRESIFFAGRTITNPVNPGNSIKPLNPSLNPSVHRIHFLKTTWFKYAAAILIIAGIGAYLWNTNPQPDNTPSVTKTESTGRDIAPGGEKALLTLADGSIINLDSAANGQLATQGSAAIVKTADGQVQYTNLLNPDNPLNPSYNTMSTPRGGQYQLTLSDGTQVWLNAASSITYPTAFTGKERRVKIIGEVFFHVTKQSGKTFIVETRQDQIQVMGTQFNINAYEDEGAVKTSLVEGSVKMNNNAILKPGQAYSQGKINTTNISQDIAWRNGIFNFNNAGIGAVMRQLARWYDVDVQYENGVPKKILKGEIGRNLNLSEVMEVLDNLGIRTSLQNRTLTVHNP